METSKAEIISAEMEAVRQEVRELAKHAREAVAHAGAIVRIRGEAGAETRCISNGTASSKLRSRRRDRLHDETPGSIHAFSPPTRSAAGQ